MSPVRPDAGGAAVLRRAGADDAPRLAALAHWVWLDSYATAGVESRFLPYLAAAFTPAAFERLIADPRQALWLAEGESGALQGFAQLRRGVPAPTAEPPQVELERLYVAPPCTGHGLGARLLAAARGNWPGEALWLSVWVGNERAQRFYHREGGRVVGETDFMLDGQPIRNLVLAFP
ncbi:MAG: GNAT family N-acetyltransferase [Comamonadaceae bacterium]|jgi:ribosomal protein S18 acetylase RimI-like enzyme|nr:GNAT family N-acetyltransferase [Comamonadaceae bacterium]